MHYALKYTLKTQSLFKTLECLHLLCHPTCFGHILDHLQGMFLVHPLKMVKYMTETCRVTQQTQTF
jgi:hypothetical protein